MNNSFIKSGEVITLHINGQLHTVTKAHTNYAKINEALKEGWLAWDAIEKLTDVAAAIESWANGTFRVLGGVLHRDDVEVHGALAARILQGIGEGESVTPFLKFMIHLGNNPSKTAVDELYLFLVNNNLPITEDGYFQAYKNVTDAYTDKHTRTFDNSIGKTCSMPRNAVDDVRDNHCSNGLHFCSLNYLRSMWGFSGRTMIVEINPADVVSIPSDYDNSKGRTAKYTVVGELKNPESFANDFDRYTDKSVVDYSDNTHVHWDEELTAEAYDAGHEDGYAHGADEGYSEGYDAAMNDIRGKLG